MKVVKLSAAQFDKFASNHRYRNYFQTSMYGNVMAKFGYSIQYLGIVNENNKLIGATLLIYKEIFMKNKMAYAPRGILFNYEDTERLEEAIGVLKRVLAKQSFMLLRIDPYIPLTIRNSEGNIMNVNNKGNNIISSLKQAGFSYKGKTLYLKTKKPRWEALITLRRDLNEIFARLDKRVRNKIRKAVNSGIIVRRDPDRSINKLYQFVGKKERKPLAYYKEIKNQFDSDIDVYYARIKTETFLINSRRNYEKEQEYNDKLAERIQDMSLDSKERSTYLNKKMQSDQLITTYKANLLKATEILKQNPDGLIIAGAMIIKYDDAAFIFTEGMDENYSNLNALYLLKWQLINDYFQRGYKYINLNGITGQFDKRNKYSGLNESKLGFDSTITEYIGEFDIILNNFTYNLYKKMNKK